MRIGIDVTASIYSGTGVATYYQSLVPRLLSLGKDHEFVLLGYALRLFPRLKLANRKLLLPPRLMELLWNRLHVVPIEFFTGTVDVFHAWDFLQPPRKKTKIVTTIHDLTTIKFPLYHHPLTVQAQSHRLHWVRREADIVITDSLATKLDIQEYLGIEEERIRVIYLAASEHFREFSHQSPDSRQKAVAEIRKKYGIEGEFSLAVGTVEPRKNLKRVIESFSALRPGTSTPATLVIAGRLGWGEQLPRTAGVKLLGLVPTRDLPPLYAAASVLVYPSLYEGFGLPVLEAMEVGCPVVTSERGSLKEVSGNAAILVDPEETDSIADGIRSALEQRDQLIRRGFVQAKKFSWKQTAARTLNIYAETQGLNR